MALILRSNVKAITSGNAPTTADLSAGQFAFGLVDGVPRLYGNPSGTAVQEYGVDDLSSLEADIASIESHMQTLAPMSAVNRLAITNIQGFSSVDQDVYLEFTRQNLLMGDGEVIQKLVPLSSSTNSGLMTAEDNQALYKVIADVEAMVGAIQYLPQIQLTNAEVTQSALTAWAIESGFSEPLPTNILITDLNNHGWVYNRSTGQWVDIGSTSVSVATNHSLGTVMGSEAVGGVYVETNGKMSVVGMADLLLRVEALEAKADKALTITNGLTIVLSTSVADVASVTTYRNLTVKTRTYTVNGTTGAVSFTDATATFPVPYYMGSAGYFKTQSLESAIVNIIT